MTESMCSTSRVLLETMREGGVRYLFANLGSDHTGIIEAYARAGPDGPPPNFPELVLCPHEGVALSARRGWSLLPVGYQVRMGEPAGPPATAHRSDAGD